MAHRVEPLYTWLRQHEDGLLSDLRRVLQIPSVKSAPESGAPFGRANLEALECVLQLCESHGMRTRNLEGYCGWAEFGDPDAKALVMVLGHLDVVPVGAGWVHPPFGAEVDGGYVYSRGAIDDKGPTLAALYAALALKQEGVPEGVRVRLVLGCDEESGFECIQRYRETEEMPTLGITPDASWPAVHAEKGIADYRIEVPCPTGDLELLEMEGGERSNVVIEHCTARLRVSPRGRASVEAALARSWDRNIKATLEGDILSLEARGKAAHGATPHLGDSAAVRIFRLLFEIAPTASVAAYRSLLFLPMGNGEGLGVAGADEVSGALSANLGKVRCREGKLELTMNVRYPVTWEGDDVEARVRARMQELGYRVVAVSDSKPLYFPREHPMIEALCEVCEAELGERLAPKAIGGGTYARAMPNTVAIGTGWAGDGPAHEADERVKIEHLHRMSRMYAHTLVKLCEIARQQT